MITAIESDEVNIDSGIGIKRYFEKEAVLSFTHWRKNAGVLKDIDIYCICPTKNSIGQVTKNKFKELNINYIEQYFPETDDFDCGFWNKPLVGKFFEQNFSDSYETIIHIDLDMYLLSPLNDEDLITNSCLVYDKVQSQKERSFPGQLHAYNTCYLVLKAKDKIFTRWYDLLKSLPTFPAEYYQKYERLEKRKLEELAFDLVSLQVEIKPLDGLMFGETYTELDELDRAALKSIKFHHYHIYDSYFQYRWLENLKRLNEIRKSF